MRELGRVFANEWMKLMRRRRFLVTGILSLCMIALFGVVTNHDYQNQKRYNPVQDLKQQIQFVQDNLNHLEQQPKSTDIDNQIAQAKQQLQADQAELKSTQDMQTGDWRTIVKQRIAADQKQIDSMSSSADPNAAPQVAATKQDIITLQYALDHDVRPDTNGITSAYKNFTQFLDIAARIFLPLLVVLLIADMVAGEATDGTIKLLLVRPVSRAKILIGKWLVSLTATVFWTVAVCAGLLVTAWAIEGKGGANQPAIANVSYTFQQITSPGQPPYTVAVPHYDHALLMPQWEFVLYGVLLTAFTMLIVATIAFLASTIFKSTMVSTASAMGSMVIGYIVMNMARHQSWISWIFPTHLDLLYNWTGQLAQMTQQSISLAAGVIVLLVWAVVAFAVSLISFTRRDVLNA